MELIKASCVDVVQLVEELPIYIAGMHAQWKEFKSTTVHAIANHMQFFDFKQCMHVTAS